MKGEDGMKSSRTIALVISAMLILAALAGILAGVRAELDPQS